MDLQRIERIATDTKRYDVNRSTKCWHWLGAKLSSGHGLVSVGKKALLAHRVFYIYFVGVIAAGLLAHHICQTPDCVNPSHIALVTPKEHGRIHAQLHGKLSYEKADDIRELWKTSRMTQTEIAKIYGVSHDAISLLIRNRTWIRCQGF